jgi:hypothetical protein
VGGLLAVAFVDRFELDPSATAFLKDVRAGRRCSRSAALNLSLLVVLKGLFDGRLNASEFYDGRRFRRTFAPEKS